MIIINTVVYVRAVLGGSATDTAIALAAAGAGSMLAALALPRLLDAFAGRRVMLAGGALLALGLSAGLLQPGFIALLPVWFVLGIGSALIQTPGGRLLRQSCRPADRPAFFSAQFALSHLCWLLTYPLAGWLGSMTNLTVTFVVLAIIVIVATVLAARFWPATDPQVLPHTHDADEHQHLHVHDEHHQHLHEGWEGPEPHSHPHYHKPVRHAHHYVIDHHHSHWPA
jgi:MFS family permease